MNITVNIPLSFKVRENNWDSEILSAIYREYKRALSLNLKEESIIIDIGAHIGGFSKQAAFIYPQAEIHAYEPDPENFSLLKENLSDNKNCILYNVGVSGQELTGKLWKKKPETDPAMYEIVWSSSNSRFCRSSLCSHQLNSRSFF